MKKHTLDIPWEAWKNYLHISIHGPNGETIAIAPTGGLATVVFQSPQSGSVMNYPLEKKADAIIMEKGDKITVETQGKRRSGTLLETNFYEFKIVDADGCEFVAYDDGSTRFYRD